MHIQKSVKIMSQINLDVIKICHKIATCRVESGEKEGLKRQKVTEIQD